MGCSASRPKTRSSARTSEQALDYERVYQCDVVKIKNARAGGSGGFIANAIIAPLISRAVRNEAVSDNVDSIVLHSLNGTKTLTDRKQIQKFLQTLAKNTKIGLKHFKQSSPHDPKTAQNFEEELGIIKKLNDTVFAHKLSRFTAYRSFRFDGMDVFGFSMHLRTNKGFGLKIVHQVPGLQVRRQDILKTSDVYTNLYFLVVQDCSINSLNEMIAKHRVHSLDMVIALEHQVMATFKPLHDNNVYFNDVKSGNIVYCGDEGFRVIDFELMRSDALPPITPGDDKIGSPGYVPPWGFDIRIVDDGFGCIGQQVFANALNVDEAIAALHAKLKKRLPKTHDGNENPMYQQMQKPLYKQYFKAAAISYFKWCQTHDPMQNKEFLNKKSDLFAFAIILAEILKSTSRKTRSSKPAAMTSLAIREKQMLKDYLKDRIQRLILFTPLKASALRGRSGRSITESVRLLNQTPRSEEATVDFGSGEAITLRLRGSRNGSGPKV